MKRKRLPLRRSRKLHWTECSGCRDSRCKQCGPVQVDNCRSHSRWQQPATARQSRRTVTEAAAPAAEQGARYQREMVQAIADMNNDIVRASYSMMERMRDALGAATQGSMASALSGAGGSRSSSTNPLEIYDSAMRQWQTAVQQMMDSPAVAMAVASS